MEKSRQEKIDRKERITRSIAEEDSGVEEARRNHGVDVVSPPLFYANWSGAPAMMIFFVACHAQDTRSITPDSFHFVSLSPFHKPAIFAILENRHPSPQLPSLQNSNHFYQL